MADDRSDLVKRRADTLVKSVMSRSSIQESMKGSKDREKDVRSPWVPVSDWMAFGSKRW
jgi:hypothetical protein